MYAGKDSEKAIALGGREKESRRERRGREGEKGAGRKRERLTLIVYTEIMYTIMCDEDDHEIGCSV